MVLQRPLRRWILILTVASPVWTPAAGAQSPLDIFSTHFGGARQYVVADQEWLSLTALLLTEFDGRLVVDDRVTPAPTDPDFLRFDGLQTSVGYNYLTWGRNKVVTRNAELWLPVLPTNSALTVAWSIHGGFTKDSLFTAPAQAGLHDFRNVTHNHRPRLEDGYLLAGVDAQAIVWPETRWLGLGAQVSFGTYHQEQALLMILRGMAAVVALDLQMVAGRVSTMGVGPQPVAAALGDSYYAMRANLSHSDRYGLGVGYSSGIFPSERELFVSLFVAVQVGSRSWLRIEHVNDLAGGKDRGPSGGARIAFARTF